MVIGWLELDQSKVPEIKVTESKVTESKVTGRVLTTLIFFKTYEGAQ
jgi:hypothetical protein